MMMRCEINCDIFNDANLNLKFTNYFELIENMFRDLIPEGPKLGYIPLKIISTDNNHTIYWPLDKSEIKMGLNFTPEEVPKACFQFAYLLSHIYIDPRVNNWFIESVCNMTGLYIIQQLGSDIKKNEKIGLNGVDLFNDYFKKRVRVAYSEIDHVQNQHSSNWIKREVKKIKNTKDWRNPLVNNMIAFELLPIFTSNPELWSSLKYFGMATNPSPSRDLTNLSSSNTTCPDFKMLKTIVPDNLNEITSEIISKIWD